MSIERSPEGVEESWSEFGWEIARLGDAVTALAVKAGIASLSTTSNGSADRGPMGDPGEFIEWHANQIGCEAHAVDTVHKDLARDLETAYPALIRISPNTFLAVLTVRGKTLNVLTPSGTKECIRLEALCDALCAPAQKGAREAYMRLLNEAAVPPKKQAEAVGHLLRERFGDHRFTEAWILRTPVGSSFRRFLGSAHAIANGGALIAAHTVQYILWLISWAILGRLSLEGRMDRGWLAAWALLLVSLIPLRVCTTWLQGLVAVGVGAALKRRLLVGALRTEPEEIRHQGIGSFLGQAFEAEAVETLALSGGITGLLALIELAFSAFVLGQLALLLGAWCVLTAAASWHFFGNYQRWTGCRMSMTADLVESMVGHRTRVAQQKPQDWHGSEDEALSEYLHRSRQIDFGGSWLVAALPRGWLVAGLIALAPSVIAGSSTTSEVAVRLGGILLAFTAFKKLTTSSVDIAAAVVAGVRILPLFRSAARSEPIGRTPPNGRGSEPAQKIVEADKVTFCYRKDGKPALHSSSVAIRSGERILLQGPSGGGKTTFASLLSGLRQPDSGLVLVNGFDHHTLGAQQWRKQVAVAPQFHENHILTETLAFNLLMGRRWPPTQQDVREAQAVCRELGLGDLLNRMPGGIMQMVGEGGWQLSQGERSRIYIARALLQQASLVILDESFAALDPENLQTAVHCTLERAKTLLVIAHP